MSRLQSASPRTAAALSSLNDAKRAPPASSERLYGLLEAFEELSAALPGEGRGGGGPPALAEIEVLLRDRGQEDGARRLREFLEPVLEELISALLDDPRLNVPSP